MPFEVYVRQLAPCVEPPAGTEAGGRPAEAAAPKGTPPPAATELKIVGLTPRKLVLSLSGPGQAAIRVRRLVELPRHRWPFLRTIPASAGAAGQLEVSLSDLPPGRYRFNVRLAGSRIPGAVRKLTIGSPG